LMAPLLLLLPAMVMAPLLLLLRPCCCPRWRWRLLLLPAMVIALCCHCAFPRWL
jgi:hypothetical protein